MKEQLKKIGNILFLQFAVMVYSVNTVVAKYVALEPWFSLKFILLYLLEFAVLGVYAILWQQIIKRTELSVAYANKAMTLLWSLLWGVLLFHEGVTFLKVLGVLLVMAGTVILNTGNVAADPSTGSGTVLESEPSEISGSPASDLSIPDADASTSAATASAPEPVEGPENDEKEAQP